MRLGILTVGALSLAIATSAGADSLTFGSLTDNTTGGATSGNSNDVSASHTASAGGTSANIKAQVSADQGPTTNPTAIADMTVSYDLPYTVTRTVSNGPGATANVPIQTITFTIALSGGEVSKDNSQTTGGLGNALFYHGTVQSLGGLFPTATLSSDASQLGGGGLARTNLSNTAASGTTYGTTVNFSGPAAGEISLVSQIPTDFRLWSDFSPPKALNYTQPWSVTQSLTDTLRISFRLRVESRASGSISVTGGEALACVGQTSPLGSFSLGSGANCGSGVNITGSLTQTGTSTVAVPEPGTLLLIGAGVAGLAYAARRKLS